MHPSATNGHVQNQVQARAWTTVPYANGTGLEPQNQHRSQHHHHHDNHSQHRNHQNHNNNHEPPQKQQQQHQYYSHSKQNGYSANSKDNIGGNSGGVKSIKVGANKDGSETASDKQNQNTWCITNEHSYYDSPGSIPVIPLFTHTTNSTDFHKNQCTGNGKTNDAIIDFTKCMYPNGTSVMPSTRNGYLDDNPGKNNWSVPSINQVSYFCLFFLLSKKKIHYI